MGLRQGTVASFFFDMLAMDVMEPFSLLEAIATLLHTTTQYISNDERKPRSDPSLDLRRALFFNITTFSPKVRRFPRPRIMPVGHLHESSQPNASPKILMINFRLRGHFHPHSSSPAIFPSRHTCISPLSHSTNVRELNRVVVLAPNPNYRRGRPLARDAPRFRLQLPWPHLHVPLCFFVRVEAERREIRFLAGDAVGALDGCRGRYWVGC